MDDSEGRAGSTRREQAVSGRKVRGRLKSLSHTGHRARKKAHNEETNRKGKIWAKQHVEQDKMRDLPGGEFRDRAARRRIKQLGVELPEEN